MKNKLKKQLSKIALKNQLAQKQTDVKSFVCITHKENEGVKYLGSYDEISIREALIKVAENNEGFKNILFEVVQELKNKKSFDFNVQLSASPFDNQLQKLREAMADVRKNNFPEGGFFSGVDHGNELVIKAKTPQPTPEPKKEEPIETSGLIQTKPLPTLKEGVNYHETDVNSVNLPNDRIVYFWFHNKEKRTVYQIKSRNDLRLAKDCNYKIYWFWA